MIGAKKLKVWVYERAVGEFEQVANGSFRFSYFKNVHPREEVSLLMPVDKGPYLFKTFPAVFGQHIPQGVPRATIEDAFKRIPGVKTLTEMDMLSIVGRNQCGRVSFTDTDCEILVKPTQIDIDKKKVEDCVDGEALFKLYMGKPRKMGEHSGLAGAMAKMFGKTGYTEPDPYQDINVGARSSHTIVYDETILKSTNPLIPNMTINEKTCLDIARHAGFTVPKYSMSKDGELLLLKRFDRQGGHMLGFEDFSSLASYKDTPLIEAQYAGTYAGVMKAASQACKNRGCSRDDTHRLHKDLFERIVLSNFLRDNDLHLKNIGLLYSKKTVRLSPVYDVTCTDILNVYHFDMDSDMSVPWETKSGSRAWKNHDQLVKFGVKCASLDPSEAEESVSRIKGAIQKWCERTIKDPQNPIELDIACAIAPGVDLEMSKTDLSDKPKDFEADSAHRLEI